MYFEQKIQIDFIWIYLLNLDNFRYAEAPSQEEFPMFESLKLTIERTLPYWNDVIVPQVLLKTTYLQSH